MPFAPLFDDINVLELPGLREDMKLSMMDRDTEISPKYEPRLEKK